MNITSVILGVLLILTSTIIGGYADQSQDLATVTSEKVTIEDLLNTPEKFIDKTLSIEGKITSQCGSGCWFIMSDDSGDLYVNLKPNNFVIPPAMGKKVTVTGKVITKDNDVALVGSSVDVQGTHYP
jgi:uncharacterized protein YdeI (BOF family)